MAKNCAVALVFKGALKLKQVCSGVYLVWLQKAWRYFEVREFERFSWCCFLVASSFDHARLRIVITMFWWWFIGIHSVVIDNSASRCLVLLKARERNPNRWISGVVRQFQMAGSQFLNPDRPSQLIGSSQEGQLMERVCNFGEQAIHWPNAAWRASDRIIVALPWKLDLTAWLTASDLKKIFLSNLTDTENV